MDGAKILLDVAKESADWFPPLKSALGGVNALIKHYEVSVKSIILVPQLTRVVAAIRRCQGEDQGSYPTFKQVQTKREPDDDCWGRRGEDPTLGIVQVWLRMACPAHHSQRPHSALEEIERRSQALLEKGGAARFIDKGEDSKEVAGLIERLREAITHYQVSAHQVIASSALDIGAQISQQQAIYEQITDLTVRILRLVSAHRTDD